MKRANVMWRMQMCMFAMAAMMTACQKPGPEPEPEPEPKPEEVVLNNQFQYNGGDKTDIKSVIYTVSEGEDYAFYLSPTEGLINVVQMEEADDFIRVTVKNPKGEVNVATDKFEIEYRDILVKTGEAGEQDTVALSATMDTKASKLALKATIKLNSGKKLLIGYDGKCDAERDVELNNQYELDGKTIKSIASVVDWRNIKASERVVYLYESDALVAPVVGEAGVVITLAGDVDASEIDLAKADPEKVKISCNGFESGSGMTGTMSVRIKEDKFGEIEGFAVNMDAQKDGKRLRIAYDGDFNGGYEASNTFAVTENEETVSVPVSKIFSQEPKAGSYVLALGDAESIETVADFANGHWAMRLAVLESQVGSVIDAATSAGDFGFQLYDYEAYKYYSNADSELDGTIVIYEDFTGKTDNVYVAVELTWKNGAKTSLEYYGNLTAATEEELKDENLRPVRPFEPYIQFLKKDGTELLYWNVSDMEVRHDPKFRLNTGEQVSGYCLYFKSEMYDEDIEEKTVVPQFFVPDDYMAKGVEIDLFAEGKNCKWKLDFSNSNLSSYGGYGHSDKDKYVMGCPDDAKLTVSRDEATKEWYFKFVMVDYGIFSTWSTTPTGTENKLTIEYKGKAVKYSGTKTNDLEDSFYE